jgi:hypothetical protein
MIKSQKPAVMLDLETLGTAPGCVVTSIGACAWYPQTGEMIEDFKVNITIKSALAAGLAVDGDTLGWWFTQSSKAQQAFIADAVPIHTALDMFSNWYRGLSVYADIDGIWGHGATFDVPVLTAAYVAIGEKAPWHYRTPRDTRTLFALAGYEPPRADVTHDALQDAIDQAGWVTTALKMLAA